jgi:hypothetical protein
LTEEEVNETENIAEKDAQEVTEPTDLDPLPLEDYLFPKERPWMWKSFAVMFVAFFGYYYIEYKKIIS